MAKAKTKTRLLLPSFGKKLPRLTLTKESSRQTGGLLIDLLATAAFGYLALQLVSGASLLMLISLCVLLLLPSGLVVAAGYPRYSTPYFIFVVIKAVTIGGAGLIGQLWHEPWLILTGTYSVLIFCVLIISLYYNKS